MQGLPETTPVCGQGGVGAGVLEMVVGKTWWRKERKMIWEQQIISLSLKEFNILDPDNYKGLISGLAQSAGSVAFSRCSYCAKTSSESKCKMQWGGGGKKRKRLPANAMILSISPLFLRAPPPPPITIFCSRPHFLDDLEPGYEFTSILDISTVDITMQRVASQRALIHKHSSYVFPKYGIHH